MKNPLEAFKTLTFVILVLIIFLVAGCYGGGTI